MEKAELTESSRLLWRTWHNVLHLWESWVQLVISGTYHCMVLLTSLLLRGVRDWPACRTLQKNTKKPIHVFDISLNCMREGVKDRLPHGSRSPSPSPIPRGGPTTASSAHARGLKPFRSSSHGQRACFVKPVGTATCCRQQMSRQGGGGRQYMQHRHGRLRDKYQAMVDSRGY